MRIFTVLFFTILASGLIAQSTTEDKKWVIGGAVSLQALTLEAGDTELENSSFTLSPYLGYQLSEKMLLGARVQYGRDKVTLANDGETTSNVFGFSAFLRYNVVQGNRWAAFVEPQVAFVTGSSTTDLGFGESETDVSGFSVGAALGGYYEISDSWRALISVGNLSYSSLTETDESDAEATTSGIVLDFGLQALTFGLEYKF